MDPPQPFLRLNGDILRCLFAFFNMTNSRPLITIANPRPPERVDVARCALVCKALSPYALEALWARLDSLVPLLDLLGSTKKVQQAGRFFPRTPRRIYTLRGDIPDEEWKSFDKYARFVRHLVHHHSPAYDHVASSIYTLLAERSEHMQKPLLPSLAVLNCSHIDSDATYAPFLRFLGQLGGPSLKNFRLSGIVCAPEIVPAYQEALEILALKSPYLRRLELQGFPDGVSFQFFEHYKQLASAFVCGFCTPLENEHGLVRAFARLESLQVLDLRRGMRNNDKLWSAEPGFPALQSASVRAKTFNLNRLFTSITSPYLADVRIDETDDNGWQWTRALLDTISTKFSNSLRRITFQRYEYVTDDILRLLDIIEPLLRMSLLEKIEIDFEERTGPEGTPMGPPQFALSTIDLEDMATAWPKLRDFSLSGLCEFSYAPSVDGLAAFARLCPELQYLRLSCGHIWTPWTTRIPRGVTPVTLPYFTDIVPARHIETLLIPWSGVYPVSSEKDHWKSILECGIFLVATFPHCDWWHCSIEPTSPLYNLLPSLQYEHGFEPLPRKHS